MKVKVFHGEGEGGEGRRREGGHTKPPFRERIEDENQNLFGSLCLILQEFGVKKGGGYRVSNSPLSLLLPLPSSSPLTPQDHFHQAVSCAFTSRLSHVHCGFVCSGVLLPIWYSHKPSVIVFWPSFCDSPRSGPCCTESTVQLRCGQQ